MIDYMKADAEKQGLKNYHARLVKRDDPELPPHSADVVFFCDTLQPHARPRRLFPETCVSS